LFPAQWRKEIIIADMEDKKFVALPVILDDCQRTTATHKKSCLALLRLYAHDPDKFKEQLLAHIDRLLLVFKREPAVERVCKFIVHFVTSPELRKLQTGDAELGLDIIRYLLEVTDVKDKAVRFRSCQFIAGIMNSLGEDAEIE
jgi:condensin complex subunit 3